MKYYVLFNLKSGKENGDIETELLKTSLKDEELLFENLQEIEDYKEYIASIKDKGNIILCGGDGTLNYFINNTYDLEFENDVLLYSRGSGNDFARELGKEKTEEPFSIKEYLKKLPFVLVNGMKRRFINGVGYGIDGYCCEEGDKLHAQNKKVDYTMIAIMGLLFKYKPTNATVIVDGVEYNFKNVWLAPTMVGKYYGGGMMPCPKQDRFSNKVSLMVFHGSGKLQTLMIFPSIFKGEHVKNDKNVFVLEGEKVTVKFDSPRPLQIDGETVLDVSEYTVERDY